MATVTGMTEAAIKALVADLVTNASLDTETGVLTLMKKDGSTSNAGVISSTQQALEAAYPVGAIFMSTSSTNPATSLGIGTWNPWGVGKVPVGVDTNQTEFDTVQKTGGSKTHTLTTSELPSHTHSINHDHPAVTTSSDGYHEHDLARADGVGGSYLSIPKGNGTVGTSGDALAGTGNHDHTVDIPSYNGNSGSTGGANAMSLLQPYITCYMWRRVG